jgi:hypothetical protein
VDEIAVLNWMQDDRQRLLIYDAPTSGISQAPSPISYYENFGSASSNYRFVSITGVDMDDDGVDEIAALNRMQDDHQRLLLFDAPTPGGSETRDPIAYDESFGSAAGNDAIIDITSIRHW